jgi:hypothetical protein
VAVESGRLGSIRLSILRASSAPATVPSANRANIAGCQPGKSDRMTAEQLLFVRERNGQRGLVMRGQSALDEL